mgnify:CR=1 FL=1
MSILFLPPQSAGSVTIADATETTSGKIRIATSAEATAGTNDVTAMTPAKVKSVVDASVVGGVTYQGTFDASTPADLSNATKGDLYIISVAGTYAGKTWAVGDHLLVNADMGGTLDSAKIDKVDNTDAVTSVAGRTGAITLSTADVSGLATVASTGAYSDLSGTPTLGTAAALDVGTGSNNVVQLDGSGLLPAVDGSQLTNLPAPTLELNDLTDVTFTAGAGIDNYVLTYDNTSGLWGAEASAEAPLASETVAGILEIATNAEATAGTATDKALVPSNISSITTAQLDNSAGTMLEAANNLSDLANAATARTNLGLGTASVEDVGTSAGNVVQLDGAGKLPAVDGSQLTNLPSSSATPFYVSPVLSTTTAAQISDNRHQTYRFTSSGITLTIQNGSGSPTTSPVIGGIVTLVNTSSGSVTIASPAGGLGPFFVFQGSSSSAQSFTLEAGSRLSFVWVSGNSLVERASSLLDGLRDVNITSASTGEVLRYDGAEWVDAQLAYSDLSGTPTNVSTFSNDAGYLTDITAENIGDLADVDLTGLADGEILIYNSTSGNWESNPPPAPLATTTSVGLIEIAENAEATAGTATDKALVPSNISSITTAQLNNSAGTMLEAANNLSDLANAAAARTNLGLATVASTGAYSDLSGTPTLGTAAALDVGTSPNNVVQLNGSAQLPAVDGSLLTNITADISGASIGDLSDVTITAAATGEVLRYNGTAWVDAQLDYADITGLGTAAAEDVGTSAGNVVQLDGTGKLPAVDGSLLTGVTSTPQKPGLTSASVGSSYTISTNNGPEEVYILTPSANCTLNIPTAATATSGFKYNIKNMSNTYTITINETIDGVSGLVLGVEFASATIISDGTSWFII